MKIASKLAGALLGLALATAMPAAANAMTMKPAPVASESSNIINVRDRYYRNRGYYRGRGYRGRSYRRSSRRNFRRGAAIGALGGLIVGGIIADSIARDRYYRDPYYAPRRVYRPRRTYRRVNRADAHENWCYDRYRSYRAYDNTFQPYNGRRRQCISPYY